MLSREKGFYNIVRYYSRENTPPRIMATHYTWHQVQAHVNDPKTRKAGEWFDGFQQTI